MHDGSCIGINYAHRFPKCFRSLHTLLGFSICTSCRQFNLLLYQFIPFLTCTRIPCRDSHCENGSFEVLSLHLPVGYSRPPSAVNDPTAPKWERFVKVARLRFDPKTANNRFHRSIMSLYTSLMCGLSFELLWAPPGIAPLPPTGGRTPWLVPVLILPEWHKPELSFSRFLV